MTSKKVIFVGPESSGKSTLTRLCAEFLKIAFVEEVSRLYVDGMLGGIQFFNYEHFDDLVTWQLNAERQLSNQPLALLDGDILTLYVWALLRYDKVPASVIDQLPTLDDRHYLLCKPDLPWDNDGMRQHPDDRNLVFDTYLASLQSFGYTFDIVTGSGPLRVRNAVDFINQIYTI